MICLELFLGFLKVGCFAFGGAYSAIPLIRDVVLSAGWISEETLACMIAVSESTPGPIMVNLATYVGSSLAGLAGAAAATLAVVLPSFLVILIVSGMLRTAVKIPCVQAVLRGVKPCIIGVILATGLCMSLRSCFSFEQGEFSADLSALLITALLATAYPLYKRVRGKKLSPIALIALSAVLGVIFC